MVNRAVDTCVFVRFSVRRFISITATLSKLGCPKHLARLSVTLDVLLRASNFPLPMAKYRHGKKGAGQAVVKFY
jgi:hypothetical protein